jgi:hypothetical protein
LNRTCFHSPNERGREAVYSDSSTFDDSDDDDDFIFEVDRTVDDDDAEMARGDQSGSGNSRDELFFDVKELGKAVEV